MIRDFEKMIQLSVSQLSGVYCSSLASVPLFFPITSVKLAPPLFLSSFEISALSASLA